MPAWWNSLETMEVLSGYAKTAGFVLGILTGLCGAAIFVSGKRIETLKTLRQSSRALSEVEQRQIRAALPTGQRDATIKVVCPRNSPEPRKYALEFVPLLREAGWRVTVDDRAALLQPPSNLEVRVHSEGPKLVRTRGDMPDRAVALYDALRFAYLPVKVKYDESLPKDEVWLVVGFKEK